MMTSFLGSKSEPKTSWKARALALGNLSRSAPPPPADRLRVTVGNVSLTQTLGPYYVDMTSCIPAIESGYHGPFEDGVALTNVKNAGPKFSPVTASQYAVALHDAMAANTAGAHAREALLRQVDAIVARIERDGELTGFVRHTWDNSKYPSLRAPWVSAITQGNCLSAVLRAHQMTGEARYLDAAHLLFAALNHPVDRGGVRTVDRCGHVWLEEYPMSPPNHVLNGFIFAAWGALDYARATGNAEAWTLWHACVDTLRAHLEDFDWRSWSVYDLRDKELTNFHYHVNIHVPQLLALNGLTGDPLFLRYAKRWERSSRSLSAKALWWVTLRVNARIRPRFRAAGLWPES